MSRPGLRALVAATVGAGVVLSPVLGAPPAMADDCTSGSTGYVTSASSALTSLGVPASWNLATGKGVKVAVVDSGVDPSNPHLKGAVVAGGSFVPGTPSDGREDAFGHGTAIAGIIAARPISSPKSGLVGVAHDATILPVRVFYADKNPSDPDAQVPNPPDALRTAEGIRYAVQHGAQVINVSISVPPENVDVPVLRSAVDLALRKNVVVVASAGNSDDGSYVSQKRFPAAFAGVIGVSATNATGAVDNYSVHGPQVTVAAPGADVLLTPRGPGDCNSGTTPYTSWATAFVSGLAAQLRERFPRESVAQIAYRIEASADRPRLGERDDITGWGVIQPYDALTMTFDPDRPGPRLPGGAAPRLREASSSTVQRVGVATDPLAPARRASLWWTLGAVGLGALALVMRPLAGRARARRRRA